jgi:GNAT superfamily N-acetyltransferase
MRLHLSSTDRLSREATFMTRPFLIRPLLRSDHAQWRALWDGYNAFYGRRGVTALPESITESTWERFFSASEPVHALVAEDDRRVVGLAHYLFHRSTTRLNDVCYMQDLFTAENQRGLGIGRQLILAVYEAARAAGSSRVYWQTQVTNEAGRALYDKVAAHQGFIVYTHEL